MIKAEVTKIATLDGHKDAVYCISPGRHSHELISAAGDGMVVKWDFNDPKDGQLIAKVPNSIFAIRVIPNTNHLLVAHNFEGLHLIDIKDQKEIASLKLTDDRVYALDYKDGRIAVGLANGEVVLVDYANWSEIARIKVSDAPVRCLKFYGEDELLVGGSDDYLRLLNIQSEKVVYQFDKHGNSVFSIRIHDEKLFTTSRDARIRIWDLNTLDLKNEIIGHMYAIYGLSFRPDGKLFATSSMDKTIKIWHTEREQLIKVIDKDRFKGHKSSVNSVYWSNHKDWLISCSDDRSIGIWDINFEENI